MAKVDLLQLRPEGLYCEIGDFFIDPWRKVHRAVVSHAHSDHARWGMGRYLCAEEGRNLLAARVGTAAPIQGVAFGEVVHHRGVQVTLLPAGHIRGSAQVKVEYQGEIWIVTGDYKLQNDATCTPFELGRCHCLITETTFGLPIYRWRAPELIGEEINQWWQANRREGRTSVLLGYALGKTQRLLSLLDPSIGPIYEHGSSAKLTEIYRASGCDLPSTKNPTQEPKGTDFAGSMVLAPPSAVGGSWLRRFGDVRTAQASGWMQIRGIRRRGAVDRGFVLSDHVDWPGLLSVIRESGAERILTTHGYAAPVSRYLVELGLDSTPLDTPFTGEASAEEEEVESAPV